jgi:hypothetical protein
MNRRYLEQVVEEWYQLADTLDPNRFSADYIETEGRDNEAWKKDYFLYSQAKDVSLWKVSEDDDYFFMVVANGDGTYVLCDYIMFGDLNDNLVRSIGNIQETLDKQEV